MPWRASVTLWMTWTGSAEGVERAPPEAITRCGEITRAANPGLQTQMQEMADVYMAWSLECANMHMGMDSPEQPEEVEEITVVDTYGEFAQF
ncbi:hypothetical protein HGRIS_010490 [Hohenbuehelia grisea]|uniref:Uncharacterized protein n=1 Tax=Hohenbuehelia grisea TaxID=104357 RepID=A0ABR3IZE0_9AGAR